MKTNGAKQSKLKELFFRERGESDEEAVPGRVARWTSVFGVAHIFCSESNKHWKGVNSAVKHAKKMPAQFFNSQVEKGALMKDKAEKLKAVHAKYLKETKAARQAKHEEQAAATKRKRVERMKVCFRINDCDCVRGLMS